jgi:hypothetical protein
MEATRMKYNSRMATRTLVPLISNIVATQLFAATAAYDLVVVDADSFLPLKGVDVVGWFSNDNGWKAWTESAPEYVDKKTTDEDGRCHLEGETNNGRTGVNIRKPPKDYYPTTGIRYQFTQEPIFPLMHWRPTDLVITAALYKIERPVPLFVRRTILGNGQPISERVQGSFAYDLIKAAWLPPLGNGEHADIVFERMQREDFGEAVNPLRPEFKGKSYKEAVVARFTGEDNGIMEFKPNPNASLLIRTAPELGYGASYVLWHSVDSCNQHHESTDKNRHFCFRIRTRRNEKREIVESYYGKIYGDIRPVSDKKNLFGVTFLYYLNPTPNDRNLEWDRKNNLCDKPGKLEMIVNHMPTLLP